MPTLPSLNASLISTETSLLPPSLFSHHARLSSVSSRSHHTSVPTTTTLSFHTPSIDSWLSQRQSPSVYTENSHNSHTMSFSWHSRLNSYIMNLLPMSSSEPQRPANALLQPAQSLYEMHTMRTDGTYTTNSSWISDVAMSPNHYQQNLGQLPVGDGDIAVPPQAHHLVASSIPNSTSRVPLHGPSVEVLPGPRPHPPASRYAQSLQSTSSHTYPPSVPAHPDLVIFSGFVPFSFTCHGRRYAYFRSAHQNSAGDYLYYIYNVHVSGYPQIVDWATFFGAIKDRIPFPCLCTAREA